MPRPRRRWRSPPGPRSPKRLPARTETGRGCGGGLGTKACCAWDSPGPDLAGFIVVVRSTTAADWEREIWAGNGREFTLKNTPIDQLVFGVKAVDREGHESPVSAYVTQPRRVGAAGPEQNE